MIEKHNTSGELKHFQMTVYRRIYKSVRSGRNLRKGYRVVHYKRVGKRPTVVLANLVRYRVL